MSLKLIELFETLTLTQHTHTQISHNQKCDEQTSSKWMYTKKKLYTVEANEKKGKIDRSKDTHIRMYDITS